MTMERRNMVFHGRVQGVGFRRKARNLAVGLGLSGYVKNEYNGTVRMEVQGNSAVIDRMLRLLHMESYIEIEWIDAENIPLKEEKSFRVIY